MFHLAFAPLEEPPRIQTHRFFISREIYCIEQLRLYNAEDCDVMLQWTVVLAQEFDDGRRDCWKRISKEFGDASRVNGLYGGQAVSLHSWPIGMVKNLPPGWYFEADVFPSGAMETFKSVGTKSTQGLFTFLRLPEKTSSREANSAEDVSRPSVAPRSSHSD
ncbi:hypothetical protein TNCV_2009601, partial [Trichonephila clavipes]